MSDLISRSELIKHFEAIQQEENVVGLVFVAAIDKYGVRLATWLRIRGN